MHVLYYAKTPNLGPCPRAMSSGEHSERVFIIRRWKFAPTGVRTGDLPLRLATLGMVLTFFPIPSK